MLSHLSLSCLVSFFLSVKFKYFMLSVHILNVPMLNVAMLNLAKLSVAKLSVAKSSAFMLNVEAPVLQLCLLFGWVAHHCC
jgi:hypothetical protein